MMLNIPGLIRHNVDYMQILLELDDTFTSRDINIPSNKLRRFADYNIITKLGISKSLVHYKISIMQKSVISKVLDKF